MLAPRRTRVPIFGKNRAAVRGVFAYIIFHPNVKFPRPFWAVAVLAAAATLRAEWKIVSPSGDVAAIVALGENGAPRYRVSHRGKPVVLDSRLGFEVASGRHLLDGFTVVKTREETVSRTWSPPYGERATIPDRYREIVIELQQERSSVHLEVIVRAYDEGIALRYNFAGADSLVLSAERTEFRFPENTFAYEEHGTEGDYARVPVAVIKKDCERPLTLEFRACCCRRRRSRRAR
jgi:hypothetical protein